MNSENARSQGIYEEIAKKKEDEKCVFCDLRDKYIITSNDSAVLTVNIFPYINGQLLVLPNRHIETLDELENKEVLDIHNLTKLGTQLLRNECSIDNVWIILRNGDIAGKTVRHLHYNIMPYIEGLNTWNYQRITLPPTKLASDLRKHINDRT